MRKLKSYPIVNKETLNKINLLIKKCLPNLPDKYEQIIKNRPEFRWSDYLAEKEYIGAFFQHFPNKIFISPKCMCNIETAIPTIMHEYCHYLQYKEYGSILYAIYCLPILSDYMLEEEAKEVERICELSLNLDL